MRYRPLLHLFGATALTFTLLNTTGLDLLAGLSGQGWALQGEQALAKSRSGGRTRGGSFSRPSSSGSSRSSSGSSSNSNSSGSSGRIYRSGGPVIIHSSGGSTSSSSAEDWFWLLLILGGGTAVILYLLWKAKNSQSSTQELENNTVTVNQLQIALLAQAKQIQTDLTELALSADTETPAGLTELLNESALALLRSPENWSHVRTNTQTFKSREEAAQHFEQISVAERSKFSAETLVNVAGRVRQTAARLTEESEPAAYIVVTLIVGTEDDRPLFDKIHSAEALTVALQQLASVTENRLSIFEMLWTPENDRDSLSRDDLLAEYSDLIQIA